MEKKLTITEYGIYLLSVSKLEEFLKKNKIKSKKILEFFQKNHEVYLDSLKEGVWIPVLPIQSTKYIIKIKNKDENFSDEWENIFQYDGFNLEIGQDNDLWIGSLGSLLNFNKNDFSGDEQSYETLDGNVLFNGFKYNMSKNKYRVNILGFKRIHEMEFPGANLGYQFDFNLIEEFDGYKDPREDDKYTFNID